MITDFPNHHFDRLNEQIHDKEFVPLKLENVRFIQQLSCMMCKNAEFSENFAETLRLE